MATDRFKLTYIGAGSFRFSMGLFRNIVNAQGLMPMEVDLCDIDEKSLDIMTKILTRMVDKASSILGYDKSKIKITAHSDYHEALENADFVYKSISVGLQKAEWFDNYLPLKFGIPQNTGDTCGPGGLFRGLRTNLVAADIAKTMNKLCPKATLLNYTNPQASIVMAARTLAPDVQFIGLCHELFGGSRALEKYANKYLQLGLKKWQDLDLEYGGINHFAWYTKIAYNGKDLYPQLRQDAQKLMKKRLGRRGFNFHLLEKFNYFPYPGSRHIAEFMTDYYNIFNQYIQSRYWHFPYIRSVYFLDKRRKYIYRGFQKMANGKKDVPGPQKEGEHAMEMTIDWRDSNPNHHVVNIPNTHPDYAKIIPQLPDDCIVEVPGYFKGQKILPVKQIELPDQVADLIRPHAEQTRYTVDAALGNDLDLCVKAMQHDPMANWIEDDDKLEYLTKLMLYYQQEWLPEEWKEWIPKKEELEKHKWWVSKKDLSVAFWKYRRVPFKPKKSLKSKAFFWNKQ